MTRRATLQLFAIVSLLAPISYALDSDTLVVQTTPVADRQGANANERAGVDGRPMRLREGTKLVNRVGELREAGGRISFYPEGETHSLQLLENLALERVSRDLDQPGRMWSVTGMVTEFRGANFLLLHRAVLKARVSSASGPRS